MGRGLLVPSQILIGLVDPVGTRRSEDVEVDGVFEGLSLMRHVGGDAESFAGVDDDFFAVYPKLERAFEDVGELFVGMAVLGDDASFFQEDAGEHDFLADDELALQERVEVFERDSVPGDVLERHRRGDGTFGAGFRGGGFRTRFRFRFRSRHEVSRGTSSVVPSLRDSVSFDNLTRHYRPGLAHSAASRLRRLGITLLSSPNEYTKSVHSAVVQLDCCVVEVGVG
jgi:hypothetical protein